MTTDPTTSSCDGKGCRNAPAKRSRFCSADCAIEQYETPPTATPADEPSAEDASTPAKK